METVNPYQPPTSPPPAATHKPARRILAYLVPATLSVGLTLLLWALVVPTLDALTGHRFGIVIWAVTLFLSASIATFATNRLWLTETQPFAFALAYSVFGIVFCLLEGDTSNGTDYMNMTIVYGTLLTMPLAMFLLARWTVSNHRDNPQPQNDG